MSSYHENYHVEPAADRLRRWKSILLLDLIRVSGLVLFILAVGALGVYLDRDLDADDDVASLSGADAYEVGVRDGIKLARAQEAHTPIATCQVQP